LDFMRKAVFVLLDGLGIVLLLLHAVLLQGPACSAALVLGSTFLTIGLTLPIATYYQLQLSTAHFKIIRSCEAASITSIFTSRQEDSPDLENAIDIAADKLSGEIFLLGVAFPTLFSPDGSHSRPSLRNKLRDHRTRLRIAVLDPDSDAAKRRNEIEFHSPTLDNIRSTLNVGVASILVSRLEALLEQDQGQRAWFAEQAQRFPAKIDSTAHELAPLLALSVAVYRLDPMLFLMGFPSSMFVEQYHFGRAAQWMTPFGCIGKHVPVLQYASGSCGYAFFRAHFDYVWHDAEDRTEAILQSILANNEHVSDLLNRGAKRT
jgi:hypothetical protein